MPKLEFWQSPNKGSKLLILLRGESGGIGAVLDAFILSEGRVEFGLQEGEELIEEVDS